MALFKLFRLVNPTWYFSLKPELDWSYLPTVEQLKRAGYPVELDEGYRTEQARERDQAWNAFQSGFISRTTGNGLNVWNDANLPAIDEYRFIRKNFHPLWSLYVLLLRLGTLHNPITEISSYWYNRKVIRMNHALCPYTYLDYANFDSPLINSRPLVSIVIPTLNRYRYLNDVFIDLAKQTYRNFEVIVVDQSEPFQEDIYSGWAFPLTYWYQEEKALWKARNDAINRARGSFILLYDDDSLVETDWIEQHLRTMDFFDADLSSGVSISRVGAKVPAHYGYFRWSDQLDTGNVMIRRRVFEQIGLFDRQFEKQRMGDGEFGLRAYLAGFRNISNPRAKRIHLKVGEGGLRQMGSWDGWRPKGWLSPRPVPSILYFFRRYFGWKATVNIILNSVPPSLLPYRMKGKVKFVWVAFVFLPVIIPLVMVQVFVSWYQASVKLNVGPLIDKIQKLKNRASE